MAFFALEKLHRLYDGYRQRVRLPNGEWLLLQEHGTLYCLANTCPHLQSPLHNATVVHLPNHIPGLRCPAHGFEFDLSTGRPVNSANCQASLRFLPLIYNANQVGVEF